MTAVSAQMKAIKSLSSEKCLLTCSKQSVCRHRSILDKLTVNYGKGDNIIEPPCYHNRSIQRQYVESGAEIPRCVASAKTGNDNTNWRQMKNQKDFALYSCKVELE